MKKLLILLICFIFGFLLFNNYKLSKELKVAYSKNADLETELKNKVQVSKDKIVYVYRDKETNTAKQEEFYVPVDGKVEILTPEEGKKLDLNLLDKMFNKVIKQDDGTIILIKNKGFTIAPEIAGMYSKEFELGGQLKLVYWNRYSSGIGFTDKQTLYGYVSRNISDIIPPFKNTSFQISVGKNLKEQETRFLLGISVRL